MAATTQLEKIAELIDALVPLGDKQRGMRLEAEEWNRLVTTVREVLEIDKAQETTTRLLLEGSFATRDHEHLGEVTTTWLDPVLQGRIAEGPGSLSTRTLLADVSKRVGTAATEVARLTTIAEAQQQRNDRASVEELERSAKLRAFEQRFGGLEDLRALVTSLGGRVDKLEPAIKAVLELRSELRDERGEPINLAALVQEVAELRKLSENFNGIDGNPVRMRDIEIRLREIEDVLGLVGSGGLEGRFAALAGELTERLEERVDDKVTAARAQLEADGEAARGQLRAELDGRLVDTRDAADASADAKVAAAEARLNDTLADGLRATGDSLRAELTALVAARVDEGIKAVPGMIQAAVTGVEERVAADIERSAADTRQALERLLTDQVTGQVEAAVSAALEGLDQRIDGRLSARLDDILRTVDERVLVLVDQRLADVPGQVAAAVDERLEKLNLPGQFEQLGGRLREELRGDLGGIQEQIAGLDQRLRRLGG